MINQIFANMSIFLIGGIIAINLSIKKRAWGGMTFTSNSLFDIILISCLFFGVMCFSITVDTARFDFRYLVLAMIVSKKELKVVIPSVAICCVSRFFFSAQKYAFSYIFLATITVIILLILKIYMKKITCSSLFQNILYALTSLSIIIIYNFLFWGLFLSLLKIYVLIGFFGLSMVIFLEYIFKEIIETIKEIHMDFLTGLKNRRSFEEHLKYLSSNFFILAFVDIDHFKLINDTYGHKMGDNVLVDLSKIVLKYQDNDSFFYRLGGDEFAFIFLHKTIEQITVTLEGIMQESQNILHQYDIDEKITLSVGLDSSDGKKCDIKKSVDNALYKAKKYGRNQIFISKN